MLGVFMMQMVADLYMARWNVNWNGCTRTIEVYRSSDEGASWQFAGNIDYNGQAFISSDMGLGLTYDQGSGTLYCIVDIGLNSWSCVQDALVFRSQDQGASWTLISQMGFDYDGIYDCFTAGITVDASGVLYAYFSGDTLQNDFFLETRRSTDGGLSWQTVDTILIDTVDQDPEGEIVAGPDGTVWIIDWTGDTTYPTCYRSTDYGSTWSLAGHINSDRGATVRTAAGAWCDPDLYAVTWSDQASLKVYLSTDMGNTWTYLATVDSSFVVTDGSVSMVAETDGDLYVAGFDGDTPVRTRVYRSTNGGTNWSLVSEVPYDSTWYAQASSMSMTTSTPALYYDIRGQEGPRRTGEIAVRPGTGYLMLISRWGPVPVRIYSVNGRLVRSAVIEGKERVALEAGVYFVVWEKGVARGVVR